MSGGGGAHNWEAPQNVLHIYTIMQILFAHCCWLLVVGLLSVSIILNIWITQAPLVSGLRFRVGILHVNLNPIVQRYYELSSTLHLYFAAFLFLMYRHLHYSLLPAFTSFFANRSVFLDAGFRFVLSGLGGCRRPLCRTSHFCCIPGRGRWM